MAPKFTIKNNHLYYGGTYCTSLNTQAKLLAALCTSDNANSIRKYTDDCYYNFYLRGTAEIKQENFENVSKVIETLLQMFNTIKPYTPSGFIYLYRGFDDDITFEQAIKDCGFMSFSADYNIAKSFGKNILRIILHKPYEYRILPLERVTSAPEEYEVLLAPGRGKFYPYGNEENIDGKTIKTYIYVPNDSAEVEYSEKKSDKNKAIFDNLKHKAEKPSFIFQRVCCLRK